MPFNSYERVIYKRNPLIGVICQLRFPRILMINEKQPAEFQERIREKYPLFQVTDEQHQQFIVNIGAASMVPPTPKILQKEVINNYKFSSFDEKWHINITSTFLALSTSKYERWDIFLENLKEPLAALNDIYKPPFFERVGLRYIDAFKRSSLNLDEVDWSELIKPFALGFMSNTKIQSEIISQNTVVEIDMGNGAIAQINTLKGIPLDVDQEVVPIPGTEESFIVDSDMYMLRKNIEELESSLEYLHDYSTKLIRSIITNKLHEAMEPEIL
jgi:uncharacterized protein (TIGR04255 family)